MKLADWVDSQLASPSEDKILKVQLGPATYRIHNTPEALRRLRANCRRGWVSGPKSAPKPRRSKPIKGSYTGRSLYYWPLSGPWWTDGCIMEAGPPPKGARKSLSAAGITSAMAEEVWNAERSGLVRASHIVYNLPDDNTRAGGRGYLVGEDGSKLGVNPRYVGYFLHRYPGAEFYLGDLVVVVRHKGRQVGLIASLSEVPDLEWHDRASIPLPGKETK